MQSTLFRIFDRYYGTIHTYCTSNAQAERVLYFLEYDPTQPVSNINRYSIAAPTEIIVALACDSPRYVTEVC